MTGDRDVLAFVERDNAALIVDCARLGHMEGSVVDVTYGRGRFWTRYRPPGLVAFDLDPACGVAVADFRCLPLADHSFDVVVLDPPYKLNGTSTGRGPSAADARYGVAAGYRSIADRHALILAGLDEALRVARRRVLVKCQDQIASGRLWQQTVMVANRAVELGAVVVDVLHVAGMRAQPSGRRQLHARRNYSTLLVLEVGRK